MRPLCLAVALCACGGSSLHDVDVEVITASLCDGAIAFDRREVVQPAPSIVEVRLYSGDRVVAWGRAKLAPEGATRVRVRRSGAFSKTSTIGGECTRLTVPRAGHTATTLVSGEVFIVGGASDGATDLFDPLVETFAPGAPFKVGAASLEKTRHSATLLSNGQVLLYGGENPTPSAVAAIFDEERAAFGVLPARPNQTGRSRHVGLAVPGGGVVLAGGVQLFQGALAANLTVEVVDLTTYTIAVAPNVVLSAEDPDGLWAASLGRGVIVSGGDLWLLDVSGSSVITTAVPLTRSRASPRVFARGAELIVAGEGTSDVVSGSTVTAGPAIAAAERGGCAAQVAEDRWVFVGSRHAGAIRWDSERAEYVAQEFEAPPVEWTGQACTGLDDGTVLVTGGEASGVALDGAWVLTPSVE